MATRKNWKSLTSTERDRLVLGLHHVKSKGIVDQFARMHSAHFGHGIHRSSHFLPWHREFVLRLERELQTHHAEITVPYWDSSVDQSESDPLWGPEWLGQFDAAWNLRRVLGDVTLPTPNQVQTNQNKATYEAFWPELESAIHNPPHRWVGGVMASAASPGDPVFFLHHCWIDLLWAKWQLAHPDVPFVASGPGLGVTDPLMEWPDRSPEDVLDHRRLGYDYGLEV